MLAENVRRSLEGLLGRRQVVTNSVELITYELDAGGQLGRPEGVVFPQSTEDVVRLVRWSRQHNVPVIARGAGTGLSGGAVAERGGVVVVFSRMDRVLELDEQGRSAVVEPGIVNLRLDEVAKSSGLYYPPDPASGRTSTIGGNVAENSGGPHCFKYGVTTNYVTGLEVVLADGSVVQLGGRASDYPEYDLCGLVTGSEGTLGIVTKISVRLVRNPPAVKTALAAFDSVEQAGAAVSAVIRAGLVPATMEMMDRKITQIVEDYVHVGLPTDAGAVMIIDVDGYAGSLDAQIDEATRILGAHGVRDVRLARDAEERDKIWFGRKSAIGAIARLAPAYYTVDGTVPRSLIAETLAEVNRICDELGMRVGHVFHAGDGNLHPLILVDDPNDPELMRRVHDAGRRILDLCVGKHGSITGEHGVGIEKREYMSLMYAADELAAMLDVKAVFDPGHLLNPGKIFRSIGTKPVMEPLDVASNAFGAPLAPTSVEEAVEAIRRTAAERQRLRIVGSYSPQDSQTGDVLLATHRLSGVKDYARDDLYVTFGAGTRLRDGQEFLAMDGMQLPLATPWLDATIGGIVARNANAPLRVRYGSIRDLVLAMTIILGDGRVIRAGRPVVKNVAGYDLPKVMVGSHGTLGLIADVTFKIVPRPRARRTFLFPVEDPARGLAWGDRMLRQALVASSIVLCAGCDGQGRPESRYLLAYTAEGWPEDVAAELQAVRDSLREMGAPQPVEVEAPTGTDLWIDQLRNVSEGVLLVRIGVPPKHLPAYVREGPASLRDGAFLADLPSGLVYATLNVRDVDHARGALESLRRPALSAGGYAVVESGPESWQSELDWWGYRPSALELMRGLKARWDPDGIMNPGLFIVDHT